MVERHTLFGRNVEKNKHAIITRSRTIRDVGDFIFLCVFLFICLFFNCFFSLISTCAYITRLYNVLNLIGMVVCIFNYINCRSVNHFLCPRDLVWRRLGLHSGCPESAGIIPCRVVIGFPEKDGGKYPLPDFVSQRTVQDKVGNTLGTISDSL